MNGLEDIGWRARREREGGQQDNGGGRTQQMRHWGSKGPIMGAYGENPELIWMVQTKRIRTLVRRVLECRYFYEGDMGEGRRGRLKNGGQLFRDLHHPKQPQWGT